MKKVLVGIIISIMVVAMLFTFTACNNYKWDAVGGTEGSSQAAENNGSIAVKQGSYLYFVNGVNNATLTSKTDNEWGKASVKGSIMKSKINDDGSLTCLGVVVPKTFFAGDSEAGIYVYGDWIYYVTKSTKTNNKGEVQDGLEFMRSKTDGTKTQTIVSLGDTASKFMYTESGLYYTAESNIHFVKYTEKKIEKDEVVAEKYTDIVLAKEDQTIFYTKAASNTLVNANYVYALDKNGSNKEIINPKTYYTGNGEYYLDLATQFSIDLVDYKDSTLYYTKKASNTEAPAGTYAYKFETKYTFDKAKEVKFANSAITSIYALGADKGIIDVSSATIKSYAPMTSEEEIKSDELTLSSTINILKVEDTAVYYIMNSGVYKADLLVDGKVNKNAYQEAISDEAIGSTYKVTMIGDYIYYENGSESNYYSRLNVKDYSATETKVTKAVGYIVSGYSDIVDLQSDYDLTKYVLNKNDEKIKNKAPKYFASEDLKSYIESKQSDVE